jgi:hypothetical protein
MLYSGNKVVKVFFCLRTIAAAGDFEFNHHGDYSISCHMPGNGRVAGRLAKVCKSCRSGSNPLLTAALRCLVKAPADQGL